MPSEQMKTAKKERRRNREGAKICTEAKTVIMTMILIMVLSTQSSKSLFTFTSSKIFSKMDRLYLFHLFWHY